MKGEGGIGKFDQIMGKKNSILSVHRIHFRLGGDGPFRARKGLFPLRSGQVTEKYQIGPAMK